MKLDPITQFKGRYFFLSNFYPIGIFYGGGFWRSAEHAYQSAKNGGAKYLKQIEMAETPGQAKRLGRLVALRKDWEKIKVDVMRDVIYHKFSQDYDLCVALDKTNGRELIEGNTWGDKFWGAVWNPAMKKFEGENWLGKILMEQREKTFIRCRCNA